MEISDPEKTCEIFLINIPNSFDIHSDFLTCISKNDFEVAFKQIWHIFKNIYEDVTTNQYEFGIPKKIKLYAWTPYRPVSLLYLLSISGVIKNQILIVDTAAFNEVKTKELKNIHILFERLQDYGFIFEGLQKFRIPKTASTIKICYPDNPNVITILKMMADKAYRYNKVNDFNSCYFRLFTEDMDTANYDKGVDVFCDRLNAQQEKDFVYAFDKSLKEKGYFGHERHGYSYYAKESTMKSKGTYHFKLERLSKETAQYLYANAQASLFAEIKHNDQVLKLCLRIRNVDKCLDYLKQCPEPIKNIFRGSDRGCGDSSYCDKGMNFNFEGNTYWRCSCCNAMFNCLPEIENIPHYIKLVELGFKS